MTTNQNIGYIVRQQEMFTGSEILAIDFILLFHTMNVHNVPTQILML